MVAGDFLGILCLFLNHSLEPSQPADAGSALPHARTPHTPSPRVIAQSWLLRGDVATTAFKRQLVGTDRRRRTGTPSILETECIHHFYTGNSMFGTTKEGRGYSPAQDWARARRGGGGASLTGTAFAAAGGANVLRAGARFVRFFVGVAAASWSTLKARRRRKKLSRRSSQMGLWGASRPSVVSEDDESVLFSKMDQPSTTGPSSSSESTTCVKIVTPSSRRSHGAWRSLISTLSRLSEARRCAGGRAGGAASCFSAEGGCGRVGKKSPGPSGLPPLLVWRWLRCPEGAEAAAAAARVHGTRVWQLSGSASPGVLYVVRPSKRILFSLLSDDSEFEEYFG